MKQNFNIKKEKLTQLPNIVQSESETKKLLLPNTKMSNRQNFYVNKVY